MTGMVRWSGRPLAPVVLAVVVLLVVLLASAPALLARHRAETDLPYLGQAVTDTTLERWGEAEAGAGEDGARERERAERRVVDRLTAAGIDTVVLGMRRDLRYDPERVRFLAGLDVRVILAVPTFAPMEGKAVREEVRRVADRTGASVLLPQATESFPALPSNASWMRRYDLALTDLAGGTSIPGVEAVAAPGHVVRAHEIPVGFDDSTAALETRALRAVKERGVRLIVYRYATRQQVAPLDTTVSVAEQVASRLPDGVAAAARADGAATGDRAGRVAGASALTEPRPAWSVPAWVGLPAGLLGATVAALLVAVPFRRPRTAETTTNSWSVERDQEAQRGSPDLHGQSAMETACSPWEAAAQLAAALVVTVATGLLVAASGSSWAQQVGIQSFTGVKLLLLGPPLLIALLGAWRHRAALRAAATPRRVLVASALAVLVCGLYLFRSGNVGIAFTPELWLRDRLDDLLYIRPRFKEMLLGLPALTVAALAWAQGPARRWTADAARWLMMAIGAIGTASVVDTFAHFHTPVWAGLLRTGYAVVIGVPLGLLVWVLWTWVRRRRGGTLP